MTRRGYDWRAAADFRLAQRAQSTGDLRSARMLYARVIDQYPEHVAARHNAAVLEIRAERTEVALDHLRVLESRLNELAKQTRRPRSAAAGATRTLQMSHRYNKALARAIAAARGSDSKGVLEEAIKDTIELVEMVLDRLIKLEGRARGASARLERDVLLRLEPTAVIFHASVIIELSDPALNHAAKHALDRGHETLRDRAEQRLQLREHRRNKPDTWTACTAGSAARPMTG